MEISHLLGAERPTHRRGGPSQDPPCFVFIDVFLIFRARPRFRPWYVSPLGTLLTGRDRGPLPNDPIGVRPFPTCCWCRFRSMRANIIGPAHPDRVIRRRQQQLEECPGSLVFGRGSVALRTLHDDGPFGRANAPPPYSAALLQHQFKNWELIDVAIQGNFHLTGAWLVSSTKK